MTTQNLRSNSEAPEIWPFGVLMEAPAPDEIEDPSLKEEEPLQIEAIVPPAPPIMAAPVPPLQSNGRQILFMGISTLAPSLGIKISRSRQKDSLRKTDLNSQNQIQYSFTSSFA